MAAVTMAAVTKAAVTKAVGVLALQGGFSAHQRVLEGLGAEVCEVRRPAQLDELAGLVIPGGESTTLLKLMDHDPGWWTALEAFHRSGKALFGTCAGLILLAREVEPKQRSLGLIDVSVSRNAYGRQIDSFEAKGTWSDGQPLEMVFIRAPRILRVSSGVTVLAEHEGEPVLVEQGNVMAGSFHPELTDDGGVHQRFLSEVAIRSSKHFLIEPWPRKRMQRKPKVTQRAPRRSIKRRDG